MIDTYADIAERDAAIKVIKARCRDMIARIQRSLGPTGIARLTAMPVWIDGVWGDYWTIELDGEPIGDLFYDGFGPVPKGEAFCLIYVTRADN